MNLTGRAREGKLDRVIGRDVETERVIQILNRRQKNNPCLIGEPGVGKSTLLLQACRYLCESSCVLYVTGEESLAQIKLRADRLGIQGDQDDQTVGRSALYVRCFTAGGHAPIRP